MSLSRPTCHGLAVLLLLAAHLGLSAAARAADALPASVFGAVAARVVPATVSIAVERGEASSPGLDELGAFLGRAPGSRGPAVATGTGSGVIVRPDGLVLTNHHVVAAASSLRVSLADKRSFPARVVGSDARTDVAVLQIEGKGPFPWAPIGDSDALRVGDPVITVGHPFDFAFTVTAGIVSARGRRNVSEDEIQDYIQTDAAVNPGASGGPLFDRRGEVVGITTAIYASARGDGPPPTGLSFAIPIRLAWRVSRELMEQGRPARPHLGLVVEDAPADGAEPGPGVRVAAVRPGGPAERAGLRVGDVLLAVDGEPVASRAELAALVASRGVGEVLRLRVSRDGVEREIGASPEDARMSAAPRVVVPGDAGLVVGMTLAPARPDLVSALGVFPPPESEGLLVLALEPGSPADLAGVAVGDVVVAVAEQDVADIEGLRRALDERAASSIALWRADGRVTVVLRCP